MKNVCEINIIIPAYNAHTTIRQAIHSIAMQDNIEDILVTVVDDFSDEGYEYLLGEFNYLNIEILRKPFNSGCGQSRQYGIDNTQCKYFMFLDADDCLFAPNAIKTLLYYLKKDDLDFIFSDFAEENYKGEYVLHENSGVWMHGKVFKTEFIRKNNIRYNMTRVNEDHSFNTIVLSVGGKSTYINCVTYIWKYCENSITRCKDFYTNCMDDFVVNAEYTISELIRLNINIGEICSIVESYIISFYAYYNIISNIKNFVALTRFQCNIENFIRKLPYNIYTNISLANIEKEFYNKDIIGHLIRDFIIDISFYDYFYGVLNFSNDKIIIDNIDTEKSCHE